MSTRAERRAERERQQQADFDLFEQQVLAARNAVDDDPRRPLLRSLRFWIPMLILLIVVAAVVTGVIVGLHIYDRAMAAKISLEQAMPLASEASDAILAGDTERAKQLTAQVSKLIADARKQTDDDIWKGSEWVPLVGPNLYAVRTAAVVTDDLVQDALTPASGLSLDALKPKNGAIDLDGITAMQGAVSQASGAVNAASKTLGTIDHDALIPQVSGAIDKHTGAVDELQPMLAPASEILGVLPDALGADKPKHYLLRNTPGQKHTLAVTFTGAAGEYGPLDVRHTPMVRPVKVTTTAPGCDEAK